MNLGFFVPTTASYGPHMNPVSLATACAATSGPLASASDHSARHEKGAHGMGAATTPRRSAVVVVAGAGRGIGRATALKLPESWCPC